MNAQNWQVNWIFLFVILFLDNDKGEEDDDDDDEKDKPQWISKWFFRNNKTNRKGFMKIKKR